MPSPFQLSTPSAQTTLMSDTELASLADGYTVAGAAVTPDNNTRAQFDLILTSSVSLSTKSAPFVRLYGVPVGNDGSNYPSYTTGAEVSTGVNVPTQYLLGVFLFTSTNGAQRQTFSADMTALNNRAWKPVLTNNLGTALPASGNSLTMKTYGEQY